MPKLILVSHYVPPDNSPGSIRAMRMVEQLTQLGWSIRVVATRSSSTRRDNDLLKRWPADVGPAYVSYLQPYLLLTDLWARWQGDSADPGTSASHSAGVGRKTPSLLKRLNRAVTGLAYSYYYPDLFAPWIAPAVRTIFSLHKAEPADAVLTTAGPWSTLFVGYHASRRLKLPWIVDYRDPWTIALSSIESMRPARRLEQDRVWQQRFLDECAACCVVSQELYAAYSERYRVSPAKMQVLPIGYDDLPQVNQVSGYDSARFVIGYVGNVAMMVLAPFLQAMSSWLGKFPDRRRQVRLRFVGEMDNDHKLQISANGLDDIVEYAGIVSRERAWAEACAATVLLLLWYATDQALGPGSKLFTYLASGRPILAVVPPGSGARILQESGQGLVVQPEYIESVEAAIDTLWNVWSVRALQVTFPGKPDYLDQYSQRHIMRNLDAIMRLVIQSR